MSNYAHELFERLIKLPNLNFMVMCEMGADGSSCYPRPQCDFLAHYMNYVSVVGKYLLNKEMLKGVDMSKLTDEQWYDMKNASYEVARDELCNTYQFARYYFTQNIGGYSLTAVLVSI